MRVLILCCLLVAPTCFAQEYPYPPSVGYIYIHSSFSSLPSIYIDEWGNARVDAFCTEKGSLDLRLGEQRYREAAQILHGIKFHTLPYNLEYHYESLDGELVLVEHKCDHCARYHVTFNDGRFWRMHIVEFVRFPEEKDALVDAIERVIHVVVRDHEKELCEGEG